MGKMNGDHARTVRFRSKCYEAQGGKCHWCEGQMTTEKPAPGQNPDLYYHTVEHLLPSCEGGSGRAENLRAACYFCNSLYDYVCTVVLPQLRTIKL